MRNEVTGRIDLPALTRNLYTVMLVPRPRLGDESESGAGISKAFLQQHANITGDEIAGSRRVSIVNNSCNILFLRSLGSPQVGIERIQSAASVDQERLSRLLYRNARLLGLRDVPYQRGRWRNFGCELDERREQFRTGSFCCGNHEVGRRNESDRNRDAECRTERVPRHQLEP